MFGHMDAVMQALAARLAEDLGAGALRIKVLGGREEACYYYLVVRLVAQTHIDEEGPGPRQGREGVHLPDNQPRSAQSGV